jgi:hypothetical protein
MHEMAKAAADNRHGIPWRILGWGGAACLLLVPLAAHFPWTLSDFVVAAVMLGTAGGALELAVRFSRGSLAYRAGAGFAVAAAFLLVWVNGAVGFLGDEDNPANLVFAAVLLVTLLGAILARFRPAGMARAMLAAAAVQFLIAPIAWFAHWGSLYEIVLGTTLFTALWLVSAALFRKAAA